MPTKVIVFEVRQWVVTHGNADFAGTAWQYRFMKWQGQ
jgi:hypothetical protein